MSGVEKQDLKMRDPPRKVANIWELDTANRDVFLEHAQPAML